MPTAVGLLIAIGVLEADALAPYALVGELALDGKLTTIPGALAAAIGANQRARGFPGCPRRV